MRISILTLSGKNDDTKRTVLAVDRKSVRSVRRSERVARLAFYGRQHVAMVARGRRASQDAGQVMTGASGKRIRAFVTGASSGLGAEICLELARRGWDWSACRDAGPCRKAIQRRAVESKAERLM